MGEPQPAAHIRPFNASDENHIRFLIGKAAMEPLAIANHRACTHPLTIAVWLAISGIFVEFMHWWPSTKRGPLGVLSPLPALAAIAVPLMFLMDWLNRPYFEDHVQEILRNPDTTNILEYYSRSPASGFWILEYNNRFVGLIALDASRDSMSGNSPVSTKSPDNKKSSKGTSSVATIRHFYVDEAYRSSDIQKDLLDHAVRYAFDSNAVLQRIQAPDSPLTLYIRDCLRAAGFRLQGSRGKVGIFGWKLGIRVLERKDWVKISNE